MKAVKWLDEHLEETILVVLLALISCVELMQVVCRNIDFISSLTWAEEMCRFLWIATVFISLPYTIRTSTMLRVTALVDVMPWKAHNVMNVIVDIVIAVALAYMGYYAVDALSAVYTSGELSSAMRFPMWILYLLIVIGFFAGALRSVQMAVIHIRDINVKPMTAAEADAAFEVSAASIDGDDIAAQTAAAEVPKGADAVDKMVAPETEGEKSDVENLINATWTNNGMPTTSDIKDASDGKEDK